MAKRSKKYQDAAKQIDRTKKYTLVEAVELAKKYSTEDSSSFINGILAKVVYELGIK